MDFNDGNNFLSDWEYNVGETGNFEEPMEMAWTEQDLTSGYFASDFVDYSKVPTFSQNWEHAGIVSQASGPCTPISNHSRLLTPVSSPQGCYFDQDISYSGFCNPLGIVSHLPTPPSSQPGNFAGFSDPHSSFEFSYQSSHMTPSYHFNSSQRFNPSPVDSNFEPYPEVSTSSVPFAHMLSWLFGKPHVFISRYEHAAIIHPSTPVVMNTAFAVMEIGRSWTRGGGFSAISATGVAPEVLARSSSRPWLQYHLLLEPSTDLRQEISPPPFQFLDPLQLQLPMRPLLSMGQESSQMAPNTAQTPGKSLFFIFVLHVIASYHSYPAVENILDLQLTYVSSEQGSRQSIIRWTLTFTSRTIRRFHRHQQELSTALTRRDHFFRTRRSTQQQA